MKLLFLIFQECFVNLPNPDILQFIRCLSEQKYEADVGVFFHECGVFAEFLIAAGFWALHVSLWDPSVFLAVHPSRHASLCLIWEYPFVSVCELSRDGLTPPCVSDETFVAFLLAFFLSFCLSPTPCPSLNEACSPSKWKQTGQKKNHAPVLNTSWKSWQGERLGAGGGTGREGESLCPSFTLIAMSNFVPVINEWIFLLKGQETLTAGWSKWTLYILPSSTSLFEKIFKWINMTYCHNVFEMEISFWLWAHLGNVEHVMWESGIHGLTITFPYKHNKSWIDTASCKSDL